MKIITFAAIKGGVGKTTLAYNYGEWLAQKGKKVLFIDLDHQCNLTQTYQIYSSEETVAGIFLGEPVHIHSVKEGISLIAGSMNLDKVEMSLESNTSKNMLLYMWLEDNYERYGLSEFDYILLDCRPDFATATKNAIAISHAIISPIIPGDYAYKAKFNIENRLEQYKQKNIDFRTRKSYVTADLYFVGNLITHNKNSSRELVKALETEENLLGLIPDKELFNRSTLDNRPIVDMREDKQLYQEHKKFFDKIEVVFQTIYDTI